MTYQCKLWKITVQHLFKDDSYTTEVFWAYNFDESKGRDAALRWAAEQTGGISVDSILSVEVIK